MGRNYTKIVIVIILLFFLLLFYHNFQRFCNKQIYNGRETTESFLSCSKVLFLADIILVSGGNISTESTLSYHLMHFYIHSS